MIFLATKGEEARVIEADNFKDALMLWREVTFLEDVALGKLRNALDFPDALACFNRDPLITRGYWVTIRATTKGAMSENSSS